MRDLFHGVNLANSNNEVDAEQFSTISVGVISHLLKQRCITLTPFDEDDLKLPCKSYFMSNLVAKYGKNDKYISIHEFNNILERLEIGESKNNGETHDESEDHGSHRKRRDVHSLNNSTNQVL